jgi:GT2 family glycosyltransferase
MRTRPNVAGKFAAGRAAVRPALAARAKAAVTTGLSGILELLPTRWIPWTFWAVGKITAPLPRRPRSRIRIAFARLRGPNANIGQDYPSWIRLYEPTGESARRAALVRIARLPHAPLISILMPVSNPPPDHLHATIQSVRSQFYPAWELCIAADLATGAPTAELLRQAQARDERIKIAWRKPDSPFATAHDATLGLATGSFVARLAAGDLLSPRALYEIASRIVANPEIDILYSDEDRIDESGARSMPYFKPGWNPDLMLAQDLINRSGVYRRDLINQTGGFRSESHDGQDYELALRVAANSDPGRIVHVPHILYHSRGETVSVSDDQRSAVLNLLSPSIPGVQVEPAPSNPAWTRVIYPIARPEPLVSVIIPTRNHADMLARAVEGLRLRTDYPSLQILIVDNGSDEPAALALLDRLDQDARVQVLRCPGPFNYSALNNRAVRDASGSLVLLLNNDIEVIHPDWLREMVSQAIRPEIGAVGAKLLYPDDTIQHGGITVGMGNITSHPWLGHPRNDGGYFGQLGLVRNVTAVTGACLMVRRQAFLDVGGLDQIALAVAYNDVDLCLKLIESGYRNLWTPYATLYHHESASRGTDLTGRQAVRFKQELTHMRHRWADRLDRDPYWNPNLSLHTRDVLLACPPRDG